MTSSLPILQNDPVKRGVALKTVTLGCKVNQYETEFVRQGLLGAGYEDALENPADLCIVNTCTVTNEGDSKSRQLIRKLARENPDSRIIVMGCYATRAPDELAELPNVAEVVTDKRELPDLLGRFGVVDVPTGISTFGDRHRAYVKVQDGCLLRCSYCIIPKVRPKLTSRPMNEILEEIQRLASNGYREIVLTGIHLGHYGVDWNFGKAKEEWTRLSTLVEEAVRLPGEFRIRLSSIEATELTRSLIKVVEQNADRVCPHFHVCLQSGSDGVLRRMKRRWSTRMFIDRCSMLKERLDQPALTTDVIVGFPGESGEEFNQTCETIQKIGFSKIHMFPFSPRKGTPAAEMSDQIPKKVKSERGRALAVIENKLRSEYFESLIGKPLEVLAESVDKDDENLLVGTTCRYAPLKFNRAIGEVGKLHSVTPKRLEDGMLIG